MSELEQDPITGRITGNKLSSEEARAMAKRRWSKPLKEDTEALIIEAGKTVEDCPTDFRLLCERAAGGDVRSIIEYGRRTGRYAKDIPDLDGVNTCQYADSCILIAAYAGRASQDETDAARARLQDRE